MKISSLGAAVALGATLCIVNPTITQSSIPSYNSMMEREQRQGYIRNRQEVRREILLAEYKDFNEDGNYDNNEFSLVENSPINIDEFSLAVYYQTPDLESMITYTFYAPNGKKVGEFSGDPHSYVVADLSRLCEDCGENNIEEGWIIEAKQANYISRRKFSTLTDTSLEEKLTP